MKAFAGYDFRDGELTPEQRIKLDDYITSSEEIVSKAVVHTAGDRTYIIVPKEQTPIEIFGIGNRDADKTRGTVWGAHDKRLLEVLWMVLGNGAGLGDLDFFPYRIHQASFLIRHGQAYIVDKDIKVLTPNGKGRIKELDDGLFCVELEGDKEVWHEYEYSELEWL